MDRLLRRLTSVLTLGGLLVACSGPSKSEALGAIQHGVRKEDNNCTLSLDILSMVKVQHVTKGLCVPKQGADKAKACIDALVAAGVTKRMPDSYMVTWPDDVAATSLADLPASGRHARNLVYATCVELGLLRDGRFACADARADQILKITTLGEGHADVRYSRELVLRPTLSDIEAACGPVIHPLPETTVAFVKDAKGSWTLATPQPAE